MWQVVVPSALVAAVTLYGLLLNRDPYHRLRKALDIYKDLPEPFDEAWKKAILRSELLAAGRPKGTIWVSAAVTSSIVGIALFLAVGYLWAAGELGDLGTVGSIVFGLMMGLLFSASAGTIWLTWGLKGHRFGSLTESLVEAERGAASAESAGPES